MDWDSWILISDSKFFTIHVKWVPLLTIIAIFDKITASKFPSSLLYWTSWLIVCYMPDTIITESSSNMCQLYATFTPWRRYLYKCSFNTLLDTCKCCSVYLIFQLVYSSPNWMWVVIFQGAGDLYIYFFSLVDVKFR